MVTEISCFRNAGSRWFKSIRNRGLYSGSLPAASFQSRKKTELQGERAGASWESAAAGIVGNVVWRLRPPRHSCNGCFLEGRVTWNLLISASGAPGRENFKSDRILYIPFLWNLQPPDSNIMTSVSTQLSLVLMSLLLVLPVVEAVEAGDAIALLLGVVLSITGICACLGVYARKRNGQM
ncbi:PREDICTED: uncharacterized protein LOC105529851 [Mandrillus leucophaeus]|nr:PREDICTED: uncharacterized protein LOC105529851 [Mandrillus leucophaeus]